MIISRISKFSNIVRKQEWVIKEQPIKKPHAAGPDRATPEAESTLAINFLLLGALLGQAIEHLSK